MIKKNENCINNFENFEEIKKQFPKIKDWIILDEDYDTRVSKLDNSKLYKDIIQNMPESQKYSKKETLSWIDSLNLIYRIFTTQKLKEEIKRDSRLIQEFFIPFTRNNRTDFLIVKDNKICILEFTFEISKYLDKAQQCFTYKQILEQFLTNDIEIKSYVFSYTSETKENHEKIDDQVNQCVEFLNEFFNSTQAYEELNKIKYF